MPTPLLTVWWLQHWSREQETWGADPNHHHPGQGPDHRARTAEGTCTLPASCCCTTPPLQWAQDSWG